MGRTDSELSQVQLEILLTLSRVNAHGYVIKQDIEQRMGRDSVVGSGSLYQALHRLEKRGMIAEAEGPDSPDGRRGRSYRIEPLGKQALANELSRMDRTLRFAEKASLRYKGTGS